MAAHGLAKRILVVDDEENMRHMLAAVLRKADCAVDFAANGAEALERLDEARYDFVLCDIRMPVMGGMEFLQAAGERLRDCTVIMMSAYGTIDTAIAAMKQGAYDYIAKPFRPDEVLLTLRKAEEREALRRENRALKERIRSYEKDFQFGSLVASSRVMSAVFELARKAARYATTVLILGESGTGKELIARGIHAEGPRAAKPWVPVNCGGIPETLLESELFGYRKGAFTGADRNKKGLFQEADGGTIFLDEIGELPSPLQVKLLRVLQENEIRPVGETRPERVDVRVIAATARNLEEAVRSGRFREDLYYRLKVLTIVLPPLRERPEDIPHLARHFLLRFNAKLNKEVREISPVALAWMLEYPWPGNVREMENVIERAVLLCEEAVIQPEHLPAELGAAGGGEVAVGEAVSGLSLKRAQRAIEKRLIRQALEQTGGNRTQAARLLEISHPSLLSKMKAYGIAL